MNAKIIAGLALSLAGLNAAAQGEVDFTAVDAWKISEPVIPAYQPRPDNLPLTGAARFEANQSVEVDAMLEEEFREPSRFQPSFEPVAPAGASGRDSMFGPGPELVAPDPSPVLEFRGR